MQQRMGLLCTIVFHVVKRTRGASESSCAGYDQIILDAGDAASGLSIGTKE